MSLHRLEKQLKQELKKQEASRKNKSGKKFWFLFSLLLLAVLAVSFYPTYRRWQLAAPQRLLNKAAEQENLGQFAAAEKIYRELYQDHTESEEAPEALFRIARLEQYDRRDLRKALLGYLQLEKDYPESRQLAVAREESARISKDSLGNYAQAIGFYQRLLASGSGAADRYLYEISDCYFRLENYPQARIELETLIEDYPESPLIADALYRKGGLLMLERRVAEARQTWLQLVERYPDSSYRPQAEFNLAKQLEEEDRLVDALEKYQQLTDFPRPAMLQEKIEHLKQRIAAKKKAI